MDGQHDGTELRCRIRCRRARHRWWQAPVTGGDRFGCQRQRVSRGSRRSYARSFRKASCIDRIDLAETPGGATASARKCRVGTSRSLATATTVTGTHVGGVDAVQVDGFRQRQVALRIKRCDAPPPPRRGSPPAKWKQPPRNTGARSKRWAIPPRRGRWSWRAGAPTPAPSRRRCRPPQRTISRWMARRAVAGGWYTVGAADGLSAVKPRAVAGGERQADHGAVGDADERRHVRDAGTSSRGGTHRPGLARYRACRQISASSRSMLSTRQRRRSIGRRGPTCSAHQPSPVARHRASRYTTLHDQRGRLRGTLQR